MKRRSDTVGLKICKQCGREFTFMSRTRMYCSKKCKAEALEEKRIKTGQPCWYCKNACGGCSWSRDFKPVPGWDATPVVIKDSVCDIHTYDIKKCPMFIQR